METHIKEVMTEVGLTIKDYMHPLIKATHFIKARFALILPPFDKAIELVKFQDPRLASVLAEMHEMHTKHFWDLINIIFDLEPKTNKLYSNYRDRNTKAFEEANSALTAADKLFKENQEIIQSWEQEKQTWKAEVDRLKMEIKSLEAENKKCFDKILKHSKSRPSG